MKHYVIIIWIVAFATLANADVTSVKTASKSEGKAFSEKSSISSLSSVRSTHLDNKQSKRQDQFKREEKHLDKFSAHQENRNVNQYNKTSTNAGNKSQVVKEDVTSSQSNVQAVKESSNVYASSSSQSTRCPHTHDHRDKNIATVQKSSYSNQISNQQKSSSIVTEQSSKSHNASDTQKTQSKTDTSMFTRSVKFIIHKEKKGYSEENNTTSSNSNTQHKVNKVSTVSSSSASRSEFINKTSIQREQTDYPKPHITVLRVKKKHEPKTPNVEQSQYGGPCKHKQNNNSTKTNSQSNKTRNNTKNNKKLSKVNKSKTVKKNIRRTIIEETNEDYYCEKHRKLKHHAEEPVLEHGQGAEQHKYNHEVQTQKPTPKPIPAPKRVQENHGINKQINNTRQRSKSSVKKKKVTIVKEIEEEVYCDKHSQRKRKSNKKRKSDQNRQSNSYEQNSNSTGPTYNQTQMHNEPIDVSETNKNKEDYYCDKHKPKSQSEQLSHNNNHTKLTPNPVQKTANTKKHNPKEMSKKGVKRVNKSKVSKKKTHRTIIEESEDHYYCDKHKEQSSIIKNNSSLADSSKDQKQTSNKKQNDKSEIKHKSINKKSISKKKKVQVIVEENEEYHHSEKQRKNRRRKKYNPEHIPTKSEQNPPFKVTNGTIDSKHEAKSTPKDNPILTHEPANKTSHQQIPHTEEDSAADFSHKTTTIKKKHRKFHEEQHNEENHYSEENVGILHNYNYNVKQTEDGQHVISDGYFDGKPVTNNDLPKGIDEDTVIKLQTLLAYDGSGRCYCTCQTGKKPLFFSVPRHKFNKI